MTDRYHEIYLRLWDDPQFLAQPGTVRNVWRYVYTGPDRETQGLYRLRTEVAARLLDIPEQDVTDALQTLDDISAIVWDADTGHVLIPQAIKYRKTRNEQAAKAVAAKARTLGNHRMARLMRGCAERFGDERLVAALDDWLNQPDPDDKNMGWLEALKTETNKGDTPTTGLQQVDQRPTQDSQLSETRALTINSAEPNSNETPPHPGAPTFDEFWQQYPSKKGKVKAEEKWKRLSPQTRQDAVDAIPAYVADCRINERQFQHGSTYVNSKTWEDYPDGVPHQPATVDAFPAEPNWPTDQSIIQEAGAAQADLPTEHGDAMGNKFAQQLAARARSA